MPQIHILDKAIAELIAAGEVVERPASIAKELLENSIDAGAKNISVEISGGGVRMIRISDDGCGISHDDLPKAFLRHATSKVQTENDLDGILTLGFRGEALASIAAMCKVELVTRTADEDEGTSYVIEGGEEKGCTPAGRPSGTTITVRDVFFNTPARMKFLKKDVSEGNAVAQIVDKCALSHPEIAFKFIRDGAVKLKTSGGGNLLAVIYEIYGRDFAQEMLEVDYVYENFARVSGYISKPGGAKPSRTYQNFFINARFIRTRTGMAALEEAYKGKIMSGKFPACFLNIELDAASVDVNVHPAKTEVRFVNEKPVFSSVYYAVKSALSTLETPFGAGSNHNATVRPGLTSDKSIPVQERLTASEYREKYIPDIQKSDERLIYTKATDSTSFTGAALSMNAPSVNPLARTYPARSKIIDISVDDDFEVKPTGKFSNQTGFDKIIPDRDGKIFKDVAVNEEKSDTNKAGSFEACDYRFIGEAFGTYILLEGGGELLLVDKHAAHERILYERIKSEINGGNRQVLLNPQSVALSRDEHTAITENPDKVEEIGFLIEDFGGSTVLVREIPIELSESDIAYILREFAGKLADNKKDLTPHVLDRLYYSIACRSAVKAHDKNSELELKEIIRMLGENPSITHCPHGRPVLVKLSRREIEKMFGRLG